MRQFNNVGLSARERGGAKRANKEAETEKLLGDSGHLFFLFWSSPRDNPLRALIGETRRKPKEREAAPSESPHYAWERAASYCVLEPFCCTFFFRENSLPNTQDRSTTSVAAAESSVLSGHKISIFILPEGNHGVEGLKTGRSWRVVRCELCNAFCVGVCWPLSRESAVSFMCLT